MSVRAKAKAKARERPAETTTAAAGIVTLLVALGLDKPIAAAVALGISLLPALVTWWKDRGK